MNYGNEVGYFIVPSRYLKNEKKLTVIEFL